MPGNYKLQPMAIVGMGRFFGAALTVFGTIANMGATVVRLPVGKEMSVTRRDCNNS
jgi:hypothetical protein